MKDGKLADQVAIVTGASKGIGAEIARQLAAEGASVVVTMPPRKTAQIAWSMKLRSAAEKQSRCKPT